MSAVAASVVEGTTIGDSYRVSRMLAVGGMAEIYLAKTTHGALGVDRHVVVKRLKPDLAVDPRVVAMFEEEARISSMLSHPNVVEIYDVGEDGGLPFIAMQYIRGEELNQLCRRGLAAGAFLPLEHSVEIVRQAAMALGYVHALRDAEGGGVGVVHCDISPNNLLVTEDGHLKLIDFGIARSRASAAADKHAVPGKLSYMSPEQARKDALDHRSDVFSLGVVLYEITLGRRLFKGPAADVVRRLTACEIEPPTFVRQDYPGMLESVVMRALEADPAERYASAYDMAEDLDEFLRETGRRSGSLRVARYLDQLTVASGGERRPELVSERDDGADDDALDFDRGLFTAFEPSSDDGQKLLDDWDEFDEDEQAVADALGVELQLVRSAARPVKGSQSPAPVASDAQEPSADQDSGETLATADQDSGETPATADQDIDQDIDRDIDRDEAEPSTPTRDMEFHRAKTQPPAGKSRRKPSLGPALFAAGLLAGVGIALLLRLLG